VILCTNALLMEKKMSNFKPSPYFSWAVHIDGMRERHDESVARNGVFDKAVSAIQEAKRQGFRVTTNTTVFTQDSPETVRRVLDFLNDELEVDAMMISPAYAYERAPDQEHFMGVQQTHELFKETFAEGRRKHWRLNHSPLFLDFLEGKKDFACTAWGIPSYSIFGWQRPCYLMADGYTKTYKELLDTTDWDSYGRGKDPRCENCMAHCGYEPTAVIQTSHSLKQSLRALVQG
jgi:hopanoid biosynthesis associated radical SAM protein HpnH